MHWGNEVRGATAKFPMACKEGRGPSDRPREGARERGGSSSPLPLPPLRPPPPACVLLLLLQCLPRRRVGNTHDTRRTDGRGRRSKTTADFRDALLPISNLLTEGRAEESLALRRRASYRKVIERDRKVIEIDGRSLITDRDRKVRHKNSRGPNWFCAAASINQRTEEGGKRRKTKEEEDDIFNE